MHALLYKRQHTCKISIFYFHTPLEGGGQKSFVGKIPKLDVWSFEPNFFFTLVAHWLPPRALIPNPLSSLPSLRAHYVQLPNPGDTFISMEEVFDKLERMMDQRRQDMKEYFEGLINSLNINLIENENTNQKKN